MVHREPAATPKEGVFAPRYGTVGAELDQLLDRLEAYVQQRGWPLTRQNNKHWGSFKARGRVAFGAGLTKDHRPSLYFKLPYEVAEQLRVDGYRPGRYDHRYQFIEYEVEDGAASFAPFAAVFDSAFENWRAN